MSILSVTLLAICAMILIIILAVCFMAIEYRRGVRDGVRTLEAAKRTAFAGGRHVAEEEMKHRARDAIKDAGTLTKKLGSSDEAMEDTLLLMDAAQEGIQKQFTDGMRKAGEDIQAPKRTHYAGRKLVLCTHCGYSHPNSDKPL